MCRQKQSCRSDADEVCLSELADQAIEQWSTVYEHLSNSDISEFSTGHTAIFDLYLLVCFWFYARSTKFDLHVSTSSGAFLYRPPFDAYQALTVLVDWNSEAFGVVAAP